jgi:UDP-glucose 4-epimerase
MSINLSKKINSKIGPRIPGDSKMVVADPSKINKTLNWKPKFNNLE